MKAVCDLTRPSRVEDGERWAASLERACDWVMRSCVGLDPADTAGPRRTSDGRSVWVAPTSRHMTSDRILGEEDYIISWAMEAQDAEPEPSATVDVEGLDVMQAEVAGAVAGNDRLVLAVGPAGAGKTTTLRTAVNDLHDNSRQVFGVAPSAKAARVLERETGVRSDTLAKLLHEWERRDRPPGAEFALRPGATVLVDEAGMVGTFALVRLISLAERQDWRLVLIGDHHQLQAVGRGGMFHELCRTGRAIELDRIHRFTEPWEAAASLQLRHGDPRRPRRIHRPRPRRRRSIRRTPPVHRRHLARHDERGWHGDHHGIDERTRRQDQQRRPRAPDRSRPTLDRPKLRDRRRRTCPHR